MNTTWMSSAGSIQKAVEAAPPQYLVQSDNGTLRAVDRGQRIELSQSRLDVLQHISRNQFCLVKHNLISECDLFGRFTAIGKSEQNVFGIDHGGD